MAMIIKVLAENTTLSKNFGSEHGLSLYIESNNRKILFDVGESGLFFKNAKKLDVDIFDVCVQLSWQMLAGESPVVVKVGQPLSQ